jgi:hypothetical protein
MDFVEVLQCLEKGLDYFFFGQLLQQDVCSHSMQ